MNPARILVDSITNTKAACVLCTLGLRLAKPGVFITYDKQHPRSSGGVAHFLFETSENNEARRYLAIYEAGVAETALDDFLEGAKGQSRELDQFIAQLEKLILEALIVYGRRFLDNYQVIAKSLRDDISKYVITGGTPVFDSAGKVQAIENFKVTQLKD
jgi:hypothetical protein